MRALALLVLLVPGVALGARLNASHRPQQNTEAGRSWQAFRCDEGSTVTNAIAVTAGEDCDTGDFSRYMDCRGMSNLEVAGFEYNAVADNLLDIKIWNCYASEGFLDDNLDPSGSPTADTSIKPLCVQIGPTGTGGICPDAAGTGGGWQINGTSEACRESNGAYHYIVLEIDDCGTNDNVCGDATLSVRCSP